MTSIKVTITPEHFRKSLSFTANKNPLEIALNETYPDLHALVGGTKVITDQGTYKIPTKIWGAVDGRFTPRQIDRLCAEARKNSVGIPTITFSITKQ